jgi:hypothetical protein
MPPYDRDTHPEVAYPPPVIQKASRGREAALAGPTPATKDGFGPAIAVYKCVYIRVK